MGNFLQRHFFLSFSFSCLRHCSFPSSIRGGTSHWLWRVISLEVMTHLFIDEPATILRILHIRKWGDERCIVCFGMITEGMD